MTSVNANQTILVTGASGFVGACLCRHFARKADKSWRVVPVLGPSGGAWRLEGATTESVKVDLTSKDDVRALVRDLRPAVVINCAAYGAYSHQADAARVYRVNFDAVRHMLDAVSEVSGFRAFVQAGSSSEYGLNCTTPREDSGTRPDSDYAVSKVAATSFVQYVGAKRRVPAWVLRLYSVYGPYEDASRLVPRLLAHGKKGGYPTLANPRISRDFVFIDDVCAAFERVIERASVLEPGDVFNVGTGSRSTLSDIVTRVREHFGIAEEPVWGSMPDRHWDHPDWYSDPRKAEATLGWRASTSLADGLSMTARWMDQNPSLVSAAQENSVTGGV